MPSPGARRVAAEALLEAIPRLMRQITAAAQTNGGVRTLSLGQLRLLALLKDGRRLPSELARELQISPATASELAETLVRRGLVERRDRPDDRRLTPLQITAEGLQLLEVSRVRSVAALEGVLSPLSPEELTCLERALPSLLAAVRSEHAPNETSRHGR